MPLFIYTDSIEKNDTEVIDELMSLFKRFNIQIEK